MSTGAGITPITTKKPTNWKTTTLGICGIVGAAISVVTIFAQGHVPTMEQLSAASAAVAAGWGLIHAKDAQ
jgi:hypothetical protein